jgi:hypothetical protein
MNKLAMIGPLLFESEDDIQSAHALIAGVETYLTDANTAAYADFQLPLLGFLNLGISPEAVKEIVRQHFGFQKAANGQAEPETVLKWKSVAEDADAFCGDFYNIRMALHKKTLITEADISSASGCLGYALSPLAAESLSEPTVAHGLSGMPWGFTESKVFNVADGGYYTRIIDYSWDSTKSQRDDPDFDSAFANAQKYIVEGSPVRKTNRTGPNTKGTRLASGIGPCLVSFYVR